MGDLQVSKTNTQIGFTRLSHKPGMWRKLLRKGIFVYIQASTAIILFSNDTKTLVIRRVHRFMLRLFG